MNKKAGRTFFRQPGYLLKTRGFPSPDCSGFGFFFRVNTALGVNIVYSKNVRLSICKESA